MAGFGIVAPRFVARVAGVIVILELAGGGLLLAGIYQWLGALLIAGLLATFNYALIVNLRRGRRNLDCRCFGARSVRIGWGHVVQDTLLFAMAILSSAFQPSSSTGNLTRDSLIVLASGYTVVCFLIAQELAGIRTGMRRITARVQTD